MEGIVTWPENQNIQQQIQTKDIQLINFQIWLNIFGFDLEEK